MILDENSKVLPRYKIFKIVSFKDVLIENLWNMIQVQKDLNVNEI